MVCVRRGSTKNDKQASIYRGLRPPKSDLPHIAVVIYPDGEVTGLAAVSAAAAETLVTELALKMGAHMGDNDR